MAAQKESVKTQPDKKNGQKPNPAVLPEQVREFEGVAEMSGGLLGANGDGSIEAQTAWLGDTRLQTAQRYILAGQIGQSRGNAHLQRVIHLAARKADATKNNGHRGNGHASEESSLGEPSEDLGFMGTDGVSIFSPKSLPPNGNGRNGTEGKTIQRVDGDQEEQQRSEDEHAVLPGASPVKTAEAPGEARSPATAAVPAGTETVEQVTPEAAPLGAAGATPATVAAAVPEVATAPSAAPRSAALEAAAQPQSPLVGDGHPIVHPSVLAAPIGVLEGNQHLHSVVPRPTGDSAVQFAPADYQHTEDGAAVEQRIERHIEEAKREGEDKDISPDETRKIDRGNLAQKQAELRPEAKPDVDRSAQEQGKVDQAAQKVEQRVDKPPEPQAKGAENKPSTSGMGGQVDLAAAEQAATLAAQAFAAAESQPQPDAPAMEVAPPEPVEPMDAAGMPLPGDSAAEAEMMDLASKAQSLRQEGYSLRQKAAQTRANANILQGNLQLVNKGITQAEQGVKTSTDHLQFRQEAVAQAQAVLAVSEQKAAFVAEKAPGVAAKANEGKQESGPLASEAKAKAAESAARTPDDPEAAGKSQQQSQKMNKAAADSVSVDQAITQSKDKADSLAQDAVRATAMNSETRSKIAAMQANLGQTQDRLAQMNAQNTQARTQMESLQDQPAQMSAQAEELDQQGVMLIQASVQIETQLRQVQTDYAQGMRSVPAQEAPTEESAASPEGGEAAGGEGVIQRSVEEAGYEGREGVNLAEALPSWMTGETPPSQAEREAARRDTEDRRRRQLAQISDEARGHFDTLGGGKRLWLSLRLMGQNLFASARNINWPKFGKTLARGLIDPRVSLMGVVSGLSMTLSGGANLLSGEQWAKDPVGNALKSAADIVTGLTIVLGSITLLATVIAAIMGAIILLSFGFAAPVAGPILAFAAHVMVIVGGWTIAVGKIALILQVLVFLKNLYDAATAETAEDLQSNSEQMADDITNAGTTLITMGGAKLAQIGGRGLLSRISRADGPVPYARAMPGRVAALGASLGRAATAVPGRLIRGARILAQGRLTPKSVVIDSNVAIALNKYYLGNPLQPGEQAIVQRVLAMGDAQLRVTAVTLGEVVGGKIVWKGVPITVARSSAAYQKVLRALEQAAVGKAKGAADRMIVADTCFAATEKGGIPTFVTLDKGIYNPLARMAGIDPAKLGMPVPQAFPNGFTVTIEGMTIRVKPISK